MLRFGERKQILAEDPAREAAYSAVEAVWVDFDGAPENTGQTPADNIMPRTFTAAARPR